MSWSELLHRELKSAYAVTDGLMGLVDDSVLDWKPSPENNWMTTGQLLMHLTNACGACFKGFVTGDWGLPEGVDLSKLPPEEMLTPAEKMPTVGSVAEARKLLAEDRQTAFDMLESVSEEELANRKVAAPWSPVEQILGHYLLDMTGHLKQHKDQLFYYLKLQGKPVNTVHLYGMPG